jgi:hypothetical protein
MTTRRERERYVVRRRWRSGGSGSEGEDDAMLRAKGVIYSTIATDLKTKIFVDCRHTMIQIPSSSEFF